MNNKAVSDVGFVIVSLFSVAIIFLCIMLFANTLTTKVAPILANQSNISSTALTTTISHAEAVTDWAFLLVFIFGLLGIIITSFLFYSHPAFMVLWIILMAVFVVLSVFMANAYYDVSRESVFAPALAKLPITDFIMTKLPLITLVLGIVSIIIIYSKSQRGWISTGGGF
jgi:hypothetical protein